ncbi:MAG: TfoX/Sxy family protein, partial [Candidatus Methanoperedens sp.]|nr:TfoX/Sxy family protein [Candidatus Methanoperedens sp.]
PEFKPMEQPQQRSNEVGSPSPKGWGSSLLDNMAWKKPSEELSKFLDEKISSFNVKKKKMFGCPVYFVNENMFTGVFQDDIFIRLSEPDRLDLVSKYDEASKFEPMKGRIMKEYLILPEILYNDPGKFHEWINRSFQYVSSLPTKGQKKKEKN